MGKQRRTKTAEDRFDPSSAAQNFLNAAHGFDTSKGDCGKSTAFGKLVVKAVEAGFTNPHTVTNKYGIDFKAAKKGRSTGVDSENRAQFIDDMIAKADAALG